ncbi:MAG TPA: hypothetical protein VGK56_14330, partial [Anaerolineales bacterium]
METHIACVPVYLCACLLLWLSTSLMPRQLFTAEDIRRLSREKTETLVLGYDDIITHEASDVAYALGVKVIRESRSSAGSAVTKEHRIDQVEGFKNGLPPAMPDLPPLKVVHMA